MTANKLSKPALDAINDEENVTKNVTENVTEKRVGLLLRYIEKDSSISTDQLSNILSVSQRTVMRDIDKLKEAGVIKRVGPDKGGHWEVGEKTLKG